MSRPGRWRRAALALGPLAIATAMLAACTSTAPAEDVAPPATRTAPATSAAATPGSPAAAPATPTAVAARQVNAAALARLPKATTFGDITAAPPDPNPRQVPSGLVVHPSRTVPVFVKPGGRPIAALPATQLGADTWLPVIDRKPGWLRVLLPSRPNGSTGWLHHASGHLRIAHTPYLIKVDRSRFRLSLHRTGEAGRGWTAGIGKPGAVTPAGRTFVLANVHDTKATFSDIVLPLGAHSDTYTSYGGGPGTVGIHTWPTSDTFGTASSDGCIRIPRDALRTLSTTVPLGTPVLIK